MTTFPKTLSALALLLIGFGAGAFTAASREWGTSSVVVEVLNKSSQAIQSYSVAYSTCGSKGKVVGGVLPASQSQTLVFPVCGEGGYTTEVVFADGHQVKSSEGYVESGYRTTEVVTESAIDSTQHIHGL